NHGLPHYNLQVRISRSGFDPADKLDFAGSTNREGFLQTRDQYSQAAYAVVQNGQVTVARIPIPIFEQHTAVRTLVLDPKITQLGKLTALRDRYNRRLDDCRQLQADLFKNLVAEKNHEAALTEAQNGQETLKSNLRGLQTEHDNLALAVEKA